LPFATMQNPLIVIAMNMNASTTDHRHGLFGSFEWLVLGKADTQKG